MKHMNNTFCVLEVMQMLFDYKYSPKLPYLRINGENFNFFAYCTEFSE